MTCPACNQSAMTFLRYALTLQGASFAKSVQGYLKGHRNGIHLRVFGFDKQFWLFFILTVTGLLLYVLFYRPLIAKIGIDATAAIWIGLALIIGGIFTIGLWKFARVEIAEPDHHASPKLDANQQHTL